MKIQQHGEFLYQLTRFGAFNSYLVREQDSVSVIDTNMGGSAAEILGAVRSQGLPPVRHILLTHAHGDHVASLDALHALVPDAEILISARDARFLRGERQLDPAEVRRGAALRGSYTSCSARPTRELTGGEQIGFLHVVPSPGHTPGHLAFLDTRDGTLIAGDAFQTQAGTAVSGDVRQLFPFPALATWHRPTALESARTLAALKPRRLAVGHGPVLTDPEAAMLAAIARQDGRLR